MTFLERIFDVRPAERRPVLATFGSLLLIVIGHTVLETVRDALFLRHVGVSGLGWMYIVAAALTLALGSVSARIGERFGARRALVVVQLASAAGTLAFFALPKSQSMLMALYAFSAVSGALLVPQLWSVVAGLFHAGQSRRLFGTVAVAGILGAVIGSVLAVLALLVIRVELLLLVTAAAFAASAGAVAFAPRVRSRSESALCARGPAMSVFGQERILWRIAAVVALGAITTLLVDYAFKAAVTAHVPADQLGSFFARYYAVMNVLSLVVQLGIAGRVLSRAGVVGTTGVLPSAILSGALVSLLTGGAFLAVLGLKVMDATLRHSVHRTGLELVYLALPTSARNRAKPLIDGAVARVSQAAGAGLLLLLVAAGWDSVGFVVLLAAAGAFLWGIAAWSLRTPYLALYRRTLVGGAPSEGGTAKRELDLESAEVLVEATASPRPREVIAAIGALERRSRVGLVPGLVLLHEDEEVLERALDLFGGTERRDWIHLAEKRTADPRERVRRAALRALARASVTRSAEESCTLVTRERPWIRGYIALHTGVESKARRESVVAMARGDGPEATDARLGILTAIGDAPPSEALLEVLASSLAQAPDALSLETVTLAARAAARLADPRLVPWLTERLEHREGRSAVRGALVALGQPAFDALAAKLRDPSTSRHLRVQLPRALAGFGTQGAAELLFELLRGDADGAVRYKCLRALAHVVIERGAKLPQAGILALARRDLDEHFRVRALRRGLAWQRDRDDAPAATRTKTLLAELLAEKGRQALERVFRLLKLAFPEEDLHRVHLETLHGDGASRANAGEFLDALLSPRRRRFSNEELRGLLRLLNEDLSEADAIARAASLSRFAVPTNAGEALTLLVEERDVTMASLATVLARQSASPDVVIEGSKRRSIIDSVEVLLGQPPALRGVHG